MAGRGSYPHPVLDASDDVSSSFDVRNVYVAPSRHDIEITYEVRSDDPDLDALLAKGSLKHSFRWRCSATISSDEMAPEVVKRTASGYSLRGWIDQALVRGDVTGEVRIVVAEELRGHRWSRQHPDYGDASFDLLPGDVLADGGSITFDAKKQFDPLDPPIGSCFHFVRDTSRRKGIELSYVGDDTIDVLMPEVVYDRFLLLRHRPDLQIALVMLPTLIEALGFIRRTKDDELLGDRKWFVAIDELVTDCGGWDKSPIELAQKILGWPLDQALEQGLGPEED